MIELIDAFHFLRPWWLLALPLSLLLGWRWYKNQRIKSKWRDQIDPSLLKVLLEEQQSSRPSRLFWFAGLVLSLSTLGLSGPTVERLPQPVQQQSNALLVILDLSLSMYAQDIDPSRLIRARQKISDILELRREGFTALVAYAGDAHAVSPFTDDSATIGNLLNALSPQMMPVLGSNPLSAMEKANGLFKSAHLTQGRILIVTDGIDRPNDVTGTCNPQFPISILGIGTDSGARIPLDDIGQAGRHLQSQQGESIVAKLNSGSLKQITEDCNGRYHALTLNDDDLSFLLETPLLDEDETRETDRQFDSWNDLGFWFAILAIPALLVGFRRGAVACIVLMVLPEPAFAGFWDNLWQRPDEQAYELLKRGRPEDAAELFENEQWRAAANYRSGNYDEAAKEYNSWSDMQSHYNLGNALARNGDYVGAIDAYIDVLSQDPNHQDATFNKALVEELLQEQSESDESEKSEQSSEDESNDSSSSDNADQQSDDQTENAESEQNDQNDQEPSENENSEQQQPPAQEEETESDANPTQDDKSPSRDESEEALEQWLRRVPDDPGGLLKRKFQYETNQRLRSGDYRYREQEKIW